MPEFKTVQFPDSPKGQRDKTLALGGFAAQGWRIVAETIAPGKFRGGNACCLFLVCMPLAFLAGHDDGVITVTLQRDV